MIKKSFKYVSLLCIVLALTSCVSSKKMIYFQDVENQEVQASFLAYEPKIQIGDILSINVSAINAEAALPFNLVENYGNANSKPITYLINIDGELNFPVLGFINAEGLTTKELTNNLTTELIPYLKKPIVNIRLVNFKVTVLGEVKTPGTYTIPNERISIIEAIGLAGDLNIQARRDNVLLVREQEGKRTFMNIDLSNKKLFNSPYFYLAQNDVIYVEPNKTKINSSAIGSNTGTIISAISIFISVIALIIR